MRRNRPADLLRDILDFMDKATEWTSHPEAEYWRSGHATAAECDNPVA
jgi:hypothetical protein